MNQPNGIKIEFEQAIHILKRSLFPFHYDSHTWIPGNLGKRTNINVQITTNSVVSLRFCMHHEYLRCSTYIKFRAILE